MLDQLEWYTNATQRHLENVGDLGSLKAVDFLGKAVLKLPTECLSTSQVKDKKQFLRGHESSPRDFRTAFPEIFRAETTPFALWIEKRAGQHAFCVTGTLKTQLRFCEMGMM